MTILVRGRNVRGDTEEKQSSLNHRHYAFLNTPVSDPEARAVLNIFEKCQAASNELKAIQPALDNFGQIRKALDVPGTPEATLDVIQNIQAALNDWKTGNASNVMDALESALKYFATTGDAPAGFLKYQPFYCLPPPPPPPPTPPPTPNPSDSDVFHDLQHNVLAPELKDGLFGMIDTAPERILSLSPSSLQWADTAARSARVVCVAPENERHLHVFRYAPERIRFFDFDKICEQGERYDFVFVRDLFPVSEKTKALQFTQKAFSLLKPGGHLEIQTVVSAVENDNNACDLLELFFKQSEERGEPITAVAPWEIFMKQTGFEDVEAKAITCEKVFTQNFGEYLPKLLRKDGRLDETLSAAETLLKDPQMENTLRLKIVHGRKGC